MCCAIRACRSRAYISQISYLLFLKMDEERVTQIGEASMLPAGFRWGDIKDMTGEPLAVAYGRLLEKLSRQGGIIGTIFLKAQNEIQDPAKLSRLVGLIDSETRKRWSRSSTPTRRRPSTTPRAARRAFCSAPGRI